MRPRRRAKGRQRRTLRRRRLSRWATKRLRNWPRPPALISGCCANGRDGMNEAAALARTLERAVTYRGNKGPTALPEGVRIAGRNDAAAVLRMLELEALENALVPVDWDK